MQCKNCKSSFAQHELRNELCLECTMKELAYARVHEAHLEDGLRSAEEELATIKEQAIDALARERQLREDINDWFAKARYVFSESKDALQCVEYFEALREGWCDLDTAPRVFTAEDVKPLVEALTLLQRAEIVCRDGNPATHAWLSPASRDVINQAIAHARKLGMEGA